MFNYNILDTSDGRSIFFFEFGGLPYLENKEFIDKTFYSTAKRLMPPELSDRISMDSDGMYLDGINILQPQRHSDGYSTLPVFLVSSNENFEKDELELLVLESAEITNKDIVLASHPEYLMNITAFSYKDTTGYIDEAAEDIIQNIYEICIARENQQ